MPKPMNSKLHFLMFPWLAFGHMIPFLQLANDLARRGHKISFLLPKAARLKLSNANLHPHLITFHALSVPRVEGLPHGAETTSDTEGAAALSIAMDGMQEQVEAVLVAEKPNFVVFDFADWIPKLASKMGCKTVFFSVISPTLIAFNQVINAHKGRPLTASDIMESLPKYPFSNKAVIREHEAYTLSEYANQPHNKIREFHCRLALGAKQSDAMAVRSCNEIEGAHCDHLAMLYGKPVFCTGPLLPEPREEPLDVKIANWLKKFDPGSVVFFAFGSEFVLEITQFQELVLGLELTGLPFLVAGTKPPKGTTSIQEALPEGFQERVKEKAMLHGGWVPQTQILRHRSIGCFVSHGGSASMWESLASDCQIVVVPTRRDYSMNARLMAEELQLAVEVERGENCLFSKESLSRGIKAAMDEESKVGALLKKNHKKWRDVVLRHGFADNYIDKFIQNLNELLLH